MYSYLRLIYGNVVFYWLLLDIPRIVIFTSPTREPAHNNVCRPLSLSIPLSIYVCICIYRIKNWCTWSTTYHIDFLVMCITLVQLLYITRISHSTHRPLQRPHTYIRSKIPWIFEPHLTTAYDFNYFCLTFYMACNSFPGQRKAIISLWLS